MAGKQWGEREAGLTGPHRPQRGARAASQKPLQGEAKTEGHCPHPLPRLLRACGRSRWSTIAQHHPLAPSKFLKPKNLRLPLASSFYSPPPSRPWTGLVSPTPKQIPALPTLCQGPVPSLSLAAQLHVCPAAKRPYRREEAGLGPAPALASPLWYLTAGTSRACLSAPRAPSHPPPPGHPVELHCVICS